jgi:hypothetical protein
MQNRHTDTSALNRQQPTVGLNLALTVSQIVEPWLQNSAGPRQVGIHR